MLELEEAIGRILSGIQPLNDESIQLNDAAGRILADQVAAGIDLPPFDNSAMDGYAVRAQDVAGAKANQPVPLHLIGHVPAGKAALIEVQPGTCIRLYTGSPLPKGADAVVMQEGTSLQSGSPDSIQFLEAVKPWENIRFRGEDIKSGAAVARRGDRMTVGRMSLLAALGQRELRVARRPIVALIATGSELREAGQSLSPGQIYESNRLTISVLTSQTGATPRIFPLVPDDLERTERALAQALEQCDAVVTSGGASVGDFDFVKNAFDKIGARLDFWKVAIKPGKPFAFGQWRDKFLFGLPGNPVSAMVTFLLLVRPALLALQGANDLHLTKHPGRLAESFSNRGERRHFFRVYVDVDGNVRSAGAQASHLLSSVASANALLDVPPGQTLDAGENTSVLRWESF